jgi:hypothetical protein
MAVAPKHGRTQSALPAGLLGGLIPAHPSGSSSPGSSSGSILGSTNQGTAAQLDWQVAVAELDVLQGAGVSAVWGQPLVSPEVCVVLNSLQELLSQQQQLHQQIWEQLGPPPANAAESTGGAGVDSFKDSQCCNITGRVAVSQPVAGHQSKALPHGVSSNGRTKEVQLHADTDSSSSSSSSSIESDDAGDSSVSEILLTEEKSIELDPGLAEPQQQPSQLTPSSVTAAAHLLAVGKDDPAADQVQQQQQQQQQQVLQKASSKLYAAAYADIKQNSSDLSHTTSNLLQELLLAITEQLQGHSTALLAALLSACGPQVAAAAASAAALNSSTALAEATVKQAAMEQLASPAAQLLLGPLLAEMASLEG